MIIFLRIASQAIETVLPVRLEPFTKEIDRYPLVIKLQMLSFIFVESQAFDDLDWSFQICIC